jgi:hypothetical protein
LLITIVDGIMTVVAEFDNSITTLPITGSNKVKSCSMSSIMMTHLCGIMAVASILVTSGHTLCTRALVHGVCHVGVLSMCVSIAHMAYMIMLVLVSIAHMVAWY